MGESLVKTGKFNLFLLFFYDQIFEKRESVHHQIILNRDYSYTFFVKSEGKYLIKIGNYKNAKNHYYTFFVCLELEWYKKFMVTSS